MSKRLLEKTIELDSGKKVTLRKLPLGKLSELLLVLEEIPRQISKFDTVEDDDMFSAIPKMVATSIEEVAKVLIRASDGQVTEEEIKNELGLAEVTDLLVAAYEVNDIQRVVGNVKKLFARTPAPASPKTPSSGSSEQ